MLALWLFTACLAGCDESPVAPSSARDITWKLERIEQPGGAVQIVGDPDRYTLRLEAGGSVSIGADCNRCTGRYTLSGSALSIAPLACTRAFCGATSLDSRYVEALQDAQTLAASSSQLVIRSRQGVSMRFRN